MRADNTHHLIAAARRRAQATRRRAVAALRRMDTSGLPVTFDALAREAGVSRSWLYSQPDLRAEIERLRDRPRPTTVRARPRPPARLRRLPAPPPRGRHTAHPSSWRPTTSGSATPSPRPSASDGSRRTGQPQRDTPRPRVSSPIRTP